MKVHQFKKYETENGIVLARAKKYGENIVPFGFYEDSGERLEAIQIRMEQDVYPFLQLLELEILSCFDIYTQNISYNFYIINHDVLGIDSLEKLKKEVSDYFQRFAADDLELYVNIECKKNEWVWGTQLKISIDRIIWQDLEATEDFPIWTLNISSQAEAIDNLYPIYKIEKVIIDVLEHLKKEYEFVQNENSTTKAF